MTQTNTDYVFQLTGPVTDRNFSATSANDGEDRFGDHLSQASASAGDEPYQSSNSSRAAEPPVYNDRQPNMGSNRDDDTRGASRPTGNEKDKSCTAQSSSSEQNDSAQAVNDKKDSAEKVDGKDDNDKGKSDTSAVYEQAAPAQATSGNTSQAKPAPIASATLIADIGANSAIDPAGNHTAEDDASKQSNPQVIDGSASSPQSELHVAERTTVLVATADGRSETRTNCAAATDVAEQPHAPVAAIKQSKDEKAGALLPNSKSDGDAEHEDSLQNEPSAPPTADADLLANVARNAASQAPVNSTLPVSTATTGAAVGDGASQDDPHDDSRTQARMGVSSDSIAQANKAAIVPVANGVVTNAGDSPANVQPKGEKNQQGPKPVTAQGDLAAASFARLTRANGGAGRGEQSASGGDPPPVDPARFVGRVAKAFQTAHDRGGTLQLRLSPPELGSLRLELTVRDGVMNAALQTENANARRLLLDHLPALRDRLAEQNIRVDRFDVDVRREGTGSQADARGSQQQAFQHQPEQPAPRRQSAPQPQPREAVRQESMAVAPSVSDAGLNLIV